jgi:hypothetical protein
MRFLFTIIFSFQANLFLASSFWAASLQVKSLPVKTAYADSSIVIHFLFFSKPAEDIPYIRMVERSEDIFRTFKEMAEAHGQVNDKFGQSRGPL